MASSIMHICVAKLVNNKINRDEKQLLLGSIAPDLSKEIGQTKEKTHFLDNTLDNSINIDKFLTKYKDSLKNDFVLGYYIHLYTDYLWFKVFLPNFLKKDDFYQKNGDVVDLSYDEKLTYIYNDYTNLNIKLIDEYNISLDLFYNDYPNIDNVIEEIPTDKIQLLIDKVGIIIANSKNDKTIVFDIKNIKKFIEWSSDIIINEIYRLNI